jgi:hypothetical protein
MSRKHNAKHSRSRSHYKDRLAARGLGKTPTMRKYASEDCTVKHADAERRRRTNPEVAAA